MVSLLLIVQRIQFTYPSLVEAGWDLIPPKKPLLFLLTATKQQSFQKTDGDAASYLMFVLVTDLELVVQR